MAYGISTLHTYNTGVLKESCNDNNGCTGPPANSVRPSTNTLVHQFAADNAFFLKSFATAFAKMCTAGYGLPVNVDGSTSTGKLGTLTAIDLSTCPNTPTATPTLPVSVNILLAVGNHYRELMSHVSRLC